ncbi:hypothetical protein RIF29_42066 [Crotalaria pallida]|uniref:Uncharacterized protein n=1 Tax=Crotalaria pallida TaxID=3830 RepID=A0AAN9E686_CROPI
MDPSKITQCLETLWFYSNILTGGSTQTHDNPVVALAPSEITPSIHASNVNEPPKTEEEIEPAERVVEVVECSIMDTQKSEEARKKRKRNRPGEKFGFHNDHGDFYRSGRSSFIHERYEMLALHYESHLPPFEDSVAMKMHIKSWAHAVARSVRS